jgi:branched-chain amino acid transport system ATP-binding protein
MLALGRALLQRPKLLMLDEPSLGLAPLVVREIFDTLERLNRDEGLTVLVVEQDAAVALRACKEACVLEVGRIAVSGPSSELAENEAVRRAYLGY